MPRGEKRERRGRLRAGNPCVRGKYPIPIFTMNGGRRSSREDERRREEASAPGAFQKSRIRLGVN